MMSVTPETKEGMLRWHRIWGQLILVGAVGGGLLLAALIAFLHFHEVWLASLVGGIGGLLFLVSFFGQPYAAVRAGWKPDKGKDQ